MATRKKKGRWCGWLIVGSCGAAGDRVFLTRKAARASADRTLPGNKAAYWFLRDPIRVARVYVREE